MHLVTEYKYVRVEKPTQSLGLVKSNTSMLVNCCVVIHSLSFSLSCFILLFSFWLLSYYLVYIIIYFVATAVCRSLEEDKCKNLLQLYLLKSNFLSLSLFCPKWRQRGRVSEREQNKHLNGTNEKKNKRQKRTVNGSRITKRWRNTEWERERIIIKWKYQGSNRK
jgi:hypothetical protein